MHLLALILAAVPGASEVRRCVDSAGNAVWTSEACPIGSRQEKTIAVEVDPGRPAAVPAYPSQSQAQQQPVQTRGPAVIVPRESQCDVALRLCEAAKAKRDAARRARGIHSEQTLISYQDKVREVCGAVPGNC